MPPAASSILQQRLGTPSVGGKAPSEIRYRDVWGDDRSAENISQRRVLPAQVEAILINALDGDLSDQQALFSYMIDRWPRLNHNMRTLTDAVKAAPFEVHAYLDDKGGKATASAEAKAALVKRAIWGMRPDMSRLEMAFEDCVGGLSRGTVQGHAVQEILWESRHDPAGMAIMPRAIRRTSSVYYGYPQKPFGKEAEDPNPFLQFRKDRLENKWGEFPENQFLVGIFPSHDGHPSVAGALRSLSKYFLAAFFGPEWLLSYAQLFGQPFRMATYRDETVKAKVCSMLQNLGPAGWGAFPEGTKVDLIQASASSESLPQKLLMDVADQACDILILGQTLASDTGNKGGASYALGKVHATVRRERLSSCASEVAKLLTHQLSRAVVAVNYGEATEVPEIRCILPEPEDQKANAEVLQILHGMGVEIPAQWAQDKFSIPSAKDGEKVLDPVQVPDFQDAKINKGDKIPGNDKKSEALKSARAKGADFLDQMTGIQSTMLEEIARKATEVMETPIDQLDAPKK